MICVTIAQESRRLAMADMLNAAMMGADLLEVRLDAFENDPDPKELLGARRKPVIFSCRRSEDGGSWQSSEEARVTLLKTAIIAQPDYCEIEVDIADQIRRFGPTKRVVSYTNLKETPSDIADIYEEARKKDPDVIKLTCRARTPEEAWPLVQILAKPTAPTIVVGLGRPGVMLAILGRRMGAPFTQAALERGMEAYPGQPTVQELEKVYHYRAIDKTTRFVGVTGVGQREYLNTALLNASFAALGQPTRCLPLQVGNVKLFRKIIEAVKLAGVVVEEAQQDALREVAAEVDADVAGVQLNAGGALVEHSVDLLVQPEAKKWQGAHTLTHGIAAALEARLAAAGKAIDGVIVMMAGLGPTCRSIARALKEKGAKLIFAGKDRDEANKCSRMFGGRHVQFEAIYTTLHDVLVVCPDAGDADLPEVHPSYLKSGMVVLDLTDVPNRTALMKEAEIRGCHVVPSQDALIHQVVVQVKRLTGLDAPAAPLTAALSELTPDES